MTALVIVVIAMLLCVFVLLAAGGLAAYLIMIDRQRGAPRDPDQEAR